jgi:YD repeat-containing protein
MSRFTVRGGFTRLTRYTVGVVSLAVLVSMATPASAVPSKTATPTAVSPVLVKDDPVSARIAARTQNSAVEILGERTESSTTWALPNGQLRKDSNPAPVRVQRPDGSWADVSTTLMQTQGGWTPAASPRPVTFSDGGSGPLVTFEHDGRTLSLGWKGSLAAPTIAGSSATYALSATQSLVLTARPDGFEQSLVLAKPPTAGEAAPVVSLPFTLDGLTAKAIKTGGFTFEATSASGKGPSRVNTGDEVFAIQAPVAYSAAKDPKTGEPSQVKALTAKLTTPVGADAGLQLTADAGFLTDPGTVYPVTIDPVISAVDAIGDTWVRNGDSAAHGSDTQLNAGLWTTASDTSLALIKFSTAQFQGNHVTDAKLTLFNSYSGSCTAQGVGVSALASDFNPATVTWATRPSKLTDAAYVSWTAFSHGFDASCPAAPETIDVTNTVTAWSFSTFPNYGLQIEADLSSNAWRKSFCAFDLSATAPCNTTAHQPTLSVTYNSYPWPPQSGTVTAAPQTDGTDGTDGLAYVTSPTPLLQAQIGNTDGAAVKLEGEVSYDPAYTDGSGVVWSGSGQAAAPLSTATVTVGTALVDGFHYRYRIRGTVATSTGGTDVGAWSAYTVFKEDTAPPAVPALSCTSYSAGAWTPSVGSVTCTIDTTSTHGAGYWWGLDNPSPDAFIDDTTNTGAAKAFSINPAEGQHTLYGKARDTALNVSAVTTYTFGVGNGGIITPKANAQTQQSVALTAQSKSTYTTLKYQYQAGAGGTTWTDVPFANVYPVGSNTAITAWPTGTVSGSLTNYPQLNWNVAATLAAASKPDGAVQVRVVLNPAGTVWNSAATTFVLAKTAFSSTAATSDVGPGTVSLVSGDFAIDDTDASFGGLSIGRTNTNLAPPAASTGPTGVFGAGWTSAAFGPDAGVGMYLLNDNSTAGSVTLSDSSGTKATYTGVSGGTFNGIGDSADGSKLIKSGSTWQLSDTSGTVTTWTLLSGTTYVTSQVQQTGTEGLSTYTRDGSGRITQIIAPAPTGLTCTSASLVKGCRALLLTYASATTATGTAEASWGNYSGLIQKIEYTSWDPATSAMATTQVAAYLYDNTGHLRGQWDPRISPALKTRYTYNTNGRLATETAPGRASWTMAYDTTGRLSSVSRTDPTNGTATQAVAYGIPLSGTSLPDVTSTTAATWSQSTDQAYAGAAVFPASHQLTPAADGTYAPASADWPYADLTYVDVNGRTVNTASYGAGAWHRQHPLRRHRQHHLVPRRPQPGPSAGPYRRYRPLHRIPVLYRRPRRPAVHHRHLLHRRRRPADHSQPGTPPLCRLRCLRLGAGPNHEHLRPRLTRRRYLPSGHHGQGRFRSRRRNCGHRQRQPHHPDRIRPDRRRLHQRKHLRLDPPRSHHHHHGDGDQPRHQ